MAIVCRTCNHEISKTTITVYTTAAIGAFITTVLPFLRNTQNITVETRSITKENTVEYIKGATDDGLAACANILKINCQTCRKYECWDTIKDAQTIEETK